MRFVIYRNSVLASICSMFGSAFVVMAVMSMLSGELDILSGIGVVAAGLGLMWLGSVISERKEKKKQAKAAQATARAKAYTSGTVSAQPARATTYTVQAPAATHGKSVIQCAAFAGTLFLLAALLNLWALSQYSARDPFFTVYSEDAMLIGMGILLSVTAFKARHTRKISVLFVLGFLGLTWGSIDYAMLIYDNYGFGGYSDSTGIYYSVIGAPMLKAAGFLLMTIFSLFSMEKIKVRLGSIVKWLWFIPIPLLLLAFAKDISDSYVLDILEISIEKGFAFPPRPEFLETAAQLFVILAICFTGVCFRRICQTSAAVYAQSVSRDEAPVTPAREWPVQPQSEPLYTSSEPPQQTEQVNDPDVQKKIQAYKDLLACGIISQEEYDQQIRELTRG